MDEANIAESKNGCCGNCGTQLVTKIELDDMEEMAQGLVDHPIHYSEGLVICPKCNKINKV